MYTFCRFWECIVYHFDFDKTFDFLLLSKLEVERELSKELDAMYAEEIIDNI